MVCSSDCDCRCSGCCLLSHVQVPWIKSKTNICERSRCSDNRMRYRWVLLTIFTNSSESSHILQIVTIIWSFTNCYRKQCSLYHYKNITFLCYDINTCTCNKSYYSEKPFSTGQKCALSLYSYSKHTGTGWNWNWCKHCYSFLRKKMLNTQKIRELQTLIRQSFQCYTKNI